MAPQNVLNMYEIIQLIGRAGLLITIMYPGFLLLIDFLRSWRRKKMWQKHRKIKVVIMFYFLIPLLTGCWDSKEIEQRANVLAIGIDKASEKDRKQEDEVSHLSKKYPIPDEEMIKVTAQIAVPGEIPLGPQQPGGSVKPVLVVEVVGHTLEDAILNLQQEVADEVFLGHLRIIVLSEEIARTGTARFNDFLRRNPEIRRTASLVVSKESASKYMNIIPELERIPSLYLADMVDNLSAIGKFPPSFIGLFGPFTLVRGRILTSHI